LTVKQTAEDIALPLRAETESNFDSKRKGLYVLEFLK
jgi:hypothetical protein